MRTPARTRNDIRDVDPWLLPEYDMAIGWYVYYLWRGPDLIYVGMTTDLHQRVRNHRASKDFDRVTYKRFDSERSMRRWELRTIESARPPLNKRVTPLAHSIHA